MIYVLYYIIMVVHKLQLIIINIIIQCITQHYVDHYN